MPHTSKSSATVLIYFVDRRGRECDCEVNVDYTFDGDNLRLISSELLGPADIGSWELNQLIWDAAFEHALDNYDGFEGEDDTTVVSPLSEQIAEARAEMGEARWAFLNSCWEEAYA